MPSAEYPSEPPYQNEDTQILEPYVLQEVDSNTEDTAQEENNGELDRQSRIALAIGGTATIYTGMSNITESVLDIYNQEGNVGPLINVAAGTTATFVGLLVLLTAGDKLLRKTVETFKSRGDKNSVESSSQEN